MKKDLFLRLLGLSFVLVLLMGSCKDYKDDINSLRKEVEGKANKNDVTELNKKLETLGKSLEATKKELTASVKEATDKLAKAVTQEELKQAKDELLAKVVALETYNAHVKKVEGEIATLKADLAKKASKEELDALKARVEALEAVKADDRLKVLEALLQVKEGKSALLDKVNADLADHAKRISDVEKLVKDVQDTISGLRPLNNLIVIPTHVADKGGALPVVDFTPLVACKHIVPASEVRFRVSPSDVSWDRVVDVDNIKFHYNEPTIRATGVNPEVTSVKFENGILTVGINIDTKELATGNKISQVQLEVPMKAGGSVFSDWIKLTADESIDRTDLKIARKADVNHADLILPQTLAEAKALKVATVEPVSPDQDKRVIDWEYNKEINLKEYVEVYKDLRDFTIPGAYGLYFDFDLKDETGQPISYELGVNKTDQQEFLLQKRDENDEIVPGVFEARIYDQDANRAAIGRTPIVRVVLRSSFDPTCEITIGFVKLNIVDEKIKPVVVEYQYNATEITDVCLDDYNFTLVPTDKMNVTFYRVVNKTKTEFHTDFTLTMDPTANNVGIISEKVDPNDPNSYNIIWELTKAEIQNALGDKDQATIKAVAEYKNADGSRVFKLTAQRVIKRPSFNAGALRINNYWYANNSHIRHNVAVPGDQETDSSKATFSNNINEAFQNTNLQLSLPVGSNYTYEYVFAKNQVLGAQYTPSADGKSLMYNGSVIATITDHTAGTGDILTYADNDVAKELLNRGPDSAKATLQLIIKTCDDVKVKVSGFAKDNGQFDVHFLRPISAKTKAAEFFVDAADFGTAKTLIDLRKVVDLYDWRNGVKGDNFKFSDHTTYYQYYDVKSITPDFTKVKVEGLTLNGNPTTELQSSIKLGVVNADKSIDTKEGKGVKTLDTTTWPQTVKDNIAQMIGQPGSYGVLYYDNNGTNLNQNFFLVVPVTIEYKWGKIVNTTVKIEVKSTDTL